LKIFTSKSTSQIKQKFEEMIIGWSPFKILSDDQPLSKIATVTKYRNFERERKSITLGIKYSDKEF
jgi:hypothetical protein